MIRYESLINKNLAIYSFRDENQQKNIQNEYKQFYAWINERCDKDRKDVTEKRLKYLYKTYNDLYKEIEDKLESSKYVNQLNVINRNQLYSKKIRKYIETTQQEYKGISDIGNKEYIFYDKLSSWYTLKTDMTIKIINHIYTKVKNSQTKDRTSDQNNTCLNISYSDLHNKNDIGVIVQL